MTSIVSRPSADAAPAGRRVAASFAALLLAVLSFSLMQTMVVPALPDLRHELGADTTTVSWVLSAFLLTASVATGVLGRLGDMFGKRRMLLVSLTVFAIGTLLAAVSTSIGVLIAARAVQGFGAASLPLAIGIVRDEFPRERVPVAIGWISATFGIGFGVGLIVSGLIVDALGWSWIFWACLAVVIVALVAVRVSVPESPVRAPGRVDVAGVLLLTAALVAVLLPISQGRSWGWSAPLTIGLFVAGGVLLVVFVAVERRIGQPLIDIGVLRRRAVLSASAATLIIGFGMFGAFTVVPLFVQTPPSAGYGFGASVTEAGLFMLPMAATMLLAGPVAGRLGARAGFKLPLVLATVFGAAGFAVFAAWHDAERPIYAGSAVLGIGVGFAFAAVANLVVAAVAPQQTGEAVGVNTIMRTIGGSLGAQVAATLIAARHLPGSPVPAESGYTTAFVMSAIALALAAVAAVAHPGGRR